MFLKRIALQNFRNYEFKEFGFEPSGALIIGANGTGKTNLFEAIAYCGIGKSIRFHHDEQLLRFSTQNFGISAMFRTDSELDQKVALSFSSGKKLLRINEDPIRTLSTLFGKTKIIYSAPEDLLLVNGSPRNRRQYFDLAISQVFPEYIACLREYLHIVEQRNALLKNPSAKDSGLRSWDKSFVLKMQEVEAYRQRYLKMVNESFERGLSGFSKSLSVCRIRYLSSYAGLKKASQKPDMEAILKSMEAKERLYQRCMFGAHLDDYEFIAGERYLRAYGSQGQKRICVIVLKLIQADLIESQTRIKPLLLFDDIFAELDTEHTIRLRDLIDYRYQIFIASPKHDICNYWNNLPVIDLEAVASLEN